MRKSQVIAYFGGVTATAEALELTTQAVSMWPEVVPRVRQWQIEVLTGGELRAQRKLAPKASA
ncbi:Cro/CI family transcriptional regulator [Salinicola sp. JS01]|uniref:Cro/CI family transcriptional regulator n=1 Tax=Salinicola sp. JS01 TaxID=3050071 RepID=UPI00255BE821|nr:Cro/CI family transcriptional regulator [Salinicola sp. JS01]WIX34126.1 Cro/CI family transcriptional regulator [Salinicola sp. JS01]